MEEGAGGTRSERGRVRPNDQNGTGSAAEPVTNQQTIQQDFTQQLQTRAASHTTNDNSTSHTANYPHPEIHGPNPDSSSKSRLRSTHVIPGVEHVFFEQELERMEHQAAPAGHDIIVLAVDNSKPSDMAFQFYVDNVSRAGYYLHVVHHSNYWGNYEPMDGGPSPKHCQELMEKENAKVKEIEDKYRGLMDAHKISGDFICLKGKDTWHDIIQHQEKVNAIMIVMGTRGQNSLRRTFMGSVSDSVVHHANCPVLVCCHPKH